MKTHRNRSFKSILLIATAGVLLLFVCVVGYFKFREYRSYQNIIHAEASFIVKVDADRLYSTLALDYLGNPSHYNSRNSNGVKSGLEMPANIFIYTVRSKSDLSYFCSLPIADLTAVKQFIKQRLEIENLKKAGRGITTGTSKDGKFTVAFNAETFAVAYAFKKEAVQDVLFDLLNKKNLLTDEDPRITELKKIDAHLAYIFDKFSGQGEFKDGMVHIRGDFNFEEFDVRGEAFNHRVLDKNASVKMWLNAQLPLNKHRTEIRIKDRVIYSDSLLKYYKGYFDVELSGTVNQMDSVVAYAYNEDFEKEEIRTTRAVKVPKLTAAFSTRSTALSNYLLREGILGSDGLISKQVFPLYTLYGKKKPGTFVLSTDRNSVPSVLYERSPYFFFLEVNFSQLKVQRQFPLLEKYMKGLNSMCLKAGKKRIAENYLEMTIYFKMKHINAIGQLL